MIETTASDGLYVLRLASPSRNALTPALMDALCEGIARANREASVRTVIITGGPQHFSSGADLELLGGIRSDDEAVSLSRQFQQALQQIEDSEKPVVAAVAGKVLGGALELAMACRHRVAAEGATFAMPEVKFDLCPGAGGTQRLPRLVGVQRALRALLHGEPLIAEEALAWGLVDAVCPAEALLWTAGGLARCSLPLSGVSRQTVAVESQGGQQALDEAWKWIEQCRPELIAPKAIFAAVQAGIGGSLAEGLRKEQEGFARCIRSPAARNKIYLFFATRRCGKPEPTADLVLPERTLAKAGVVGMGSMGTGIVQSLLRTGLEVVVRDESAEALARGIDRIRSSLGKRVSVGRLSESQAGQLMRRIRTTTDWEPLAEADVVIEAVFEDAAVKRAVLERLEDVCRPETLLATNTSSISLDVLSEPLRQPERLLGLHFFNPAHAMPLVEVIRGARTSEAVLTEALRLVRLLGKTPVVVRSREGFLVTRLFVPYCLEAYRVWQEGTDAAEVDRAMVEFGFPMGPLALIDMTGIDILAKSGAVLQRAFAHHQSLPEIIHRLVIEGRLGQKTGGGVYQYQAGDPTPQPSPSSAALLTAVRGEMTLEPRRMAGEEIVQRLVRRMADEAFKILAEEIVRLESDIDVATVLGLGFPDFRGGVLRYARGQGWAPGALRAESCRPAAI